MNPALGRQDLRSNREANNRFGDVLVKQGSKLQSEQLTRLLGDISTAGVYVYYKGKWAEIISPPVIDLIEEAKKKYPIGCVVKSGLTGHKYTINSQDFRLMRDGNIDHARQCSVYYASNKKWAEILTKKEDKGLGICPIDASIERHPGAGTKKGFDEAAFNKKAFNKKQTI